MDFFEFANFNGKYKKGDLYYSFGWTFSNHTRWTSKLSYKIPNTDFRVYIENSWSSGKSFVAGIERDHAFTLFGFQYDLTSNKLKGWFTPFIGISIGYARWTMYAYKNGVVPNGMDNIYYQNTYTFVMDPNVGFSFFPEGLISTSTFSYKLVFTFSVRMIFNNSKADNLYGNEYKKYKYDSAYTRINFAEPRFTIALEVGCDL